MKVYLYPPTEITQGPTRFLLDGFSTEVSKDTATPNNTIALPVEDVNVLDAINGLIPIVQSVDTVPGSSAGVPVLAFDASVNQLKYFKLDATGNLKVSAASLPLPSGAATSALQATGNSSLSSIDGKFTTLNAKDFATSANQTNGTQQTKIVGSNGNIAQVTTLSSQLALGDKVLSTAAVLHARNGSNYVDLLCDSNDYLYVNVSNFPATQAVTGTFWQATQPISAAALPLPSGASTLAEQQTQTAAIGSLTETAPATDTASSGLNGRLQRIAQRLTSLIALFPTSIGTKTSAASLSVVLASDQAAINVAQQVTSGTITNTQKSVGLTAVRATVSGSAPSATRKKLMVKPSKNNTGSVYLGSSTVTTANGLEIIGPDRLEFLLDSSDYYLISDTAGQVVEIIEVA